MRDRPSRITLTIDPLGGVSKTGGNDEIWKVASGGTPKVEEFVGGATRAFRLELGGGPGFVAYVVTDSGKEARVEAVFDQETLFRAKVGGIEVSYDYGGNLCGLVVDLAQSYAGLPASVRAVMDRETLMAVAEMERSESSLVVDIDLRDGLVLGDMKGWCQVMTVGNMKRTNGGIGGFEIEQSKRAVAYPIAIDGVDGKLAGTVYLTIGLVGGQLKIGLGDKALTYVTKFRRLIDPEKLSLARTPAGALSLLSSLVET